MHDDFISQDQIYGRFSLIYPSLSRDGIIIMTSHQCHGIPNHRQLNYLFKRCFRLLAAELFVHNSLFRLPKRIKGSHHRFFFVYFAFGWGGSGFHILKLSCSVYEDICQRYVRLYTHKTPLEYSLCWKLPRGILRYSLSIVPTSMQHMLNSSLHIPARQPEHKGHLKIQGSTLSFLAGCPKSHFLSWYRNSLVYWYLKLDNQVVTSTCPKDKLGCIWRADDP